MHSIILQNLDTSECQNLENISVPTAHKKRNESLEQLFPSCTETIIFEVHLGRGYIAPATPYQLCQSFDPTGRGATQCHILSESQPPALGENS
jgi:hypothetical protein